MQKSLRILYPEQQILDNGHFGHYTESVIKNFQIKNKIAPSGILDQNLLNSFISKVLLIIRFKANYKRKQITSISIKKYKRT